MIIRDSFTGQGYITDILQFGRRKIGTHLQDLESKVINEKMSGSGAIYGNFHGSNRNLFAEVIKRLTGIIEEHAKPGNETI